jgi:glycerol-3-phosphate dehydrogenase
MYSLPPRLDPQTRASAISAAAAAPLDLVVVGGGVVGCGVALDAASRGLAVALLERDDFGSGASSRSSKLVHGGLRYLAQFDFRLVREALRERTILLANAPHLVSPLRFLYPISRQGLETATVRAGLTLYDALAGRNASLPRHRRVSQRELRDLGPGLKATRAGAFEFWDATVDDARLTLTLARTAATLGAHVASRVEVTGFVREGGQVAGVLARDALTGATLELRARSVICAVGAEVEALGQRTSGARWVRTAPSKGAHIVVPRERIDARAALITRTADSVLFFVPWNGHWLLGTTDTPWSDASRQPAPTAEDRDYLLEQANRILHDQLTSADVIAGFAGVRPLLGASAAKTTKLSREHTVVPVDDGLIVVAGGKLTTYRQIAEEAVDAALRDGRSRPGSRTRELGLLGSDPPSAGASSALAAPLLERLRGRYGSLVGEVLAGSSSDPTLVEPVPGTANYLYAEALYAATHEGALSLEDILTRRTHIAIETRDHGLQAAEAIARRVAPALGWDGVTVQRELARYRSLVAADGLAATTVSANSTARRSIISAS